MAAPSSRLDASPISWQTHRMDQNKFDPAIPFTLQVEVTDADWDKAIAAQRAAHKANVPFDVCANCAAGQAINRAFREKFPEESESVYVTCSNNSVNVRRLSDDPLRLREIDGTILAAIDKETAPPELEYVVIAFDRGAQVRPTPKFELHLSRDAIKAGR
jgi:hypothetical protein